MVSNTLNNNELLSRKPSWKVQLSFIKVMMKWTLYQSSNLSDSTYKGRGMLSETRVGLTGNNFGFDYWKKLCGVETFNDNWLCIYIYPIASLDLLVFHRAGGRTVLVRIVDSGDRPSLGSSVTVWEWGGVGSLVAVLGLQVARGRMAVCDQAIVPSPRLKLCTQMLTSFDN